MQGVEWVAASTQAAALPNPFGGVVLLVGGSVLVLVMRWRRRGRR